MLHPTLTAIIALLALRGLCVGQWSRILHSSNVFWARVWLTLGAACGFAAIEVALIDLGPDWFKQQPVWAYVLVLLLFALLWWVEVGDRQTANADTTRDTWFKHAVFFIMHRRWPADAEVESMFDTEGELTRANGVLAEMRQMALDGKMLVWGKPTRTHMTMGGDTSSGVYHNVPPSHWTDHIVDAPELILQPHQVYTTVGLKIDGASFCALKVSNHQVEMLWPTKRV